MHRLAAIFSLILAIPWVGACRHSSLPVAPVASPPGEHGPAGTPERPVVVEAVIHHDTGHCDSLPGGEVLVGLQPFMLHVRLRPVPSAAWYRENVRTEGGPGPREELLEYGTIEISFPEGAEGDRFTIAISTVILPGREEDNLTVTLRRMEDPRATLEVWEEEAWRAVGPGQVVNQRPLKLRICFTRDMRRETVEPYLTAYELGRFGWWFPPVEELYRPAPGEITWPDNRTLVWEMADPPPVLIPSVRLARDIAGLWVAGGLPVLYTGEPPRLYARDPATGDEQAAGLVPADIDRASVSPDGKHLLAWGYEVTTAPGQPLPLAGVADLATGRWRWTDLDWNCIYVGWVSEQAILRVRPGRYEVVDVEGSVVREGSLPDVDRIRLYSLSPDGGRLAFLVVDWSYPSFERNDFNYPMDLAVVDLGTGAITWTRDFVRHHQPHTCGWRALAPPAWSPDGRRLACVADLAAGTAVRVVDLGTGEVHTVAVFADIAYGSTYRFAWSPTGEQWLVGNRLVGTVPPYASAGREDWSAYEPEHWSPDGMWLAGGEWEGARLYRVETGGVQELGPVLPSGWNGEGRLYLVRWPDAERRYIYREP